MRAPLTLTRSLGTLDVFVQLTHERDRAVIMVLHDLHLATRFCDHAIAIGHGHARAHAAPEVLNAAALPALFGRPLAELTGEGLRRLVPR